MTALNRFIHSIFPAALAMSLALSCAEHTGGGHGCVQYAEDIMNDPSGAAFQRLASFTGRTDKGSIVVIEDGSLQLSQALCSADFSDNVTGAERSDRLPDFCGERVFALACPPDSVLYDMVSCDNEMLLRELSVRTISGALDTLAQAKSIVVGSVYVSAFGFPDADTLFAVTGCGVPVSSIPQEALREASEVCQNPHVLVLCDSMTVSSGAVAAISSRMQFGTGSVDLFTPGSSSSGRELKEALEHFRVQNPGKKVDAVVSLCGITADSLAVQARQVLESPLSEDSVASAMSRQFVVVDPVRVAARLINADLRRRNVFTHNISYPQYSSRSLKWPEDVLF